jgi:hypothetical protein
MPIYVKNKKIPEDSAKKGTATLATPLVKNS